jgi:hypothetical protein
MKNIKRMIAVAVLLMSAVAAFAQSPTSRPVSPTQHGGAYRIMGGKVYYNNIIMHEADPRTIQDLGYGYAKDNEYVWFEGKILPLVDPYTFRLKHSAPPAGAVPPSSSVPPHQGSQGFGLDDLLSALLGNGSNHNGGHAPGYDQGHGHGQYGKKELVFNSGPPAYECDGCMQKRKYVNYPAYSCLSHIILIKTIAEGNKLKRYCQS